MTADKILSYFLRIPLVNMFVFGITENSSLLGPGWYILNVLRACNIIALLSMAVSSMVLVIKTDMVTNFFIFQAVAHCITCGVALLLIISELPQPAFVKQFYRNNWPTFSTFDIGNRGHSLAWLGVWMVAMGIWVLGSLNGDNLIAKLSLPLWRLTLASGILALIFGCFNFIVSTIFRDGQRSITVRMIREHGANVYNVARMTAPDYYLETSTLSSSRNNSIRKEKQAFTQFHHPMTNRFSKLFARNDNKPQISAPIITTTIHQERDVEAAYPQEHESWEGVDRASPIAPHVQVRYPWRLAYMRDDIVMY